MLASQLGAGQNEVFSVVEASKLIQQDVNPVWFPSGERKAVC